MVIRPPLIRPADWQRSVALCLLSLILASCVTPDITDWPETVPPPEVFIEAYVEDEENSHLQSQEEYLEWTLSFYQGNLAYQTGWQDLRGSVFEAPTAEQRAALLAQLRRLGIVIGSEWAKHNDVRLIDSRMLSLWGSTIQLAANFQQQRETVDLIVQDVELLLCGKLAREEIHEQRYADILGLDLFEGF